MNHYTCALQQLEDLSVVIVRNCLSNLRQFVIWCERNERQCVISKQKKEPSIPLNTMILSFLLKYLETLPQGCDCLFPSEKTGSALTERVLGSLITKYIKLAQVQDTRPHDLRYRFGYRTGETVPLHRLAQVMSYHSLDTATFYIRRTKQDLQQNGEKIAWT